MIVPKEDCFVECTKPPGSAAGKTGGIGSVCNIFDENKKSEPVPDGEEVRIFPVWWNKIRRELSKCKLGIICITKENLKAPWIFFESGAMVARNLKLIPLLVNCDIRALNGTPLSSRNMVDFYSQEKFIKMIHNINGEFQLLNIPSHGLDAIAKEAYAWIQGTLSEVLKKLKNMRVFNEKYIYPQRITTVNLNTIYISAPMSSIDRDSYYKQREFIVKLSILLKSIGFDNVISPILKNTDYDKFDGGTKAIKENFVNLKQVDSMLVIMPNDVPSSVLVEIGYGLALCKNIVIFYKDTLPYILRDASSHITHIDSRVFINYEDVISIVSANGKQLFKLGEED